jgi:hypothetical protein
MKKLSLHIMLIVVVMSVSWHLQSQSLCTMLPPTGMPGVWPPTENLACIERGVPYYETIYIENFNTFNTVFGVAQLNYLKIDSFTNLPCNLQWSINPRDSLGPAETACINLFGTTYDSVGQYRVRIYVTVSVFVPGFGNVVLSDEAETLVQQVEQLTGTPTGINFKYYLRVIQPGNNCPALDTTSGAHNIIACSAHPLSVQLIFSPDTICAGSSAQLQALVSGGTPPYTYRWSPGSMLNDSTIATPLATPNVTTTFFIKVYDNAGDSVFNQKQLVVETCSHTSDNVALQQEILIWPNPSDGIFQLMFNRSHLPDRTIEINVWNMQGKLAYSSKANTNQHLNNILDLSSLPKGMYFLHLKSGSYFSQQKIIVK